MPGLPGYGGRGGPARPGPRTPPRAGETRRCLAVALDCYLCLLTAGLLVRPYVDTATLPEAAGLLAGPVLVLSFVNQVVLTACFGAGAGKLIMGIRVVSLPDARRPGPVLLVRRWLYGLSRLPLLPWYGLRAGTGGRDGAGSSPARTCEAGASYTDPLGLRQVRRGDLLAHRRAAAGARAA
ncbi:RDD family protein [Streptomyces sp. A1277]|uniref:RDD family protein n=1 Tax=Streptomyces sp. A1277 TaxID=2563103 RepID=UPI0023EF5279|nr:RDD family protein [Streptomyces sp. A1277]